MDDINEYMERLREFIDADNSFVSGVDGNREGQTVVNNINTLDIPAITTDKRLKMSGGQGPWWTSYVAPRGLKEEEIIPVKSGVEDIKDTYNQHSLYATYTDLKNMLEDLKQSDVGQYNDIVKILIKDMQKNESTF